MKVALEKGVSPIQTLGRTQTRTNGAGAPRENRRVSAPTT